MKSKMFMFILVGLMATALFVGCAPADDDDVAVDEEVYTVIALFPMTGPLAYGNEILVKQGGGTSPRGRLTRGHGGYPRRPY